LLIDAESCSFTYPDECPELLVTVVNLLKQGLIHNVVPIGKKNIYWILFSLAYVILVCSIHDSPSFMVKCLQEGAADFLLKPLSEDIVKTLFLVKKIHTRTWNKVTNYTVFFYFRMLQDIEYQKQT
jgi:hypothetical protein